MSWGWLRAMPIIAIWSRPSLLILTGSPTRAEQSRSSNGRRLPSPRSRIERQPESHLVHAKSLAASRQNGRVASAWRRVRLVQHEGERNVRLGAARFRGRLSSQDIGDQSASGKDQKSSTRFIITKGATCILRPIRTSIEGRNVLQERQVKWL